MICIITGGTRGLGLSMANFLLSKGHKVIITSTKTISKKKIADLFPESYTDNVFHHKLNLELENSIDVFVNYVKTNYDEIGLLINNAGVNNRQDFKDISWKDYNYIFDINLRGTFFLTQKLVIHKIFKNNFSRIINISSVAGQYHGPFTAHYAMSKAAIISFTKFLARYLALENIYVNAICPGIIMTDQTYEQFKSGAAKKIINSTQFLKRPGNVKDLNSAVNFLIDHDQTYMTGQTLNISGGAII